MKNFSFVDRYGKEIKYYKWSEVENPKGIVQIVHGMTEYALRYDILQRSFVKNGYIVYAHDQRGHGETSPKDEEKGYIADDEGFDILVENVKELTDVAKKENSNLPIILFGHSMGSLFLKDILNFMVMELMELFIRTNGKPDRITKLGNLISKIEIMLKGRKAKSKLMDKLSFGDFNSNFKPTRTDYDWLCSVNEEVDKYIESPVCGFICSTSFIMIN